MSEADLIFNRANVALSRSQRLIASWLPDAPDQADKSEEQLQQEDNEVFSPIAEKLGLGAPLPRKRTHGSANRSELDSNDRLRKHLLGGYRRKASDQPLASSNTQSGRSSSHRPAEFAKDVGLDLEESRSSLGKRKRKTTTGETGTVAQIKSHEGDESGDKGRRQRNRGNSYLEELLSKRSRKKIAKEYRNG